MALETDPQELNSKLAHHLLMNMNEKCPAFVESRIGDGLQMSFIFLQSVCGCLPENQKPKVQTKASGNLMACLSLRQGLEFLEFIGSFMETGCQGTNLCPQLCENLIVQLLFRCPFLDVLL